MMRARSAAGGTLRLERAHLELIPGSKPIHALTVTIPSPDMGSSTVTANQAAIERTVMTQVLSEVAHLLPDHVGKSVLASSQVAPAASSPSDGFPPASASSPGDHMNNHRTRSQPYACSRMNPIANPITTIIPAARPANR
jgi:hypothetical protein